MAAYFGDIRDRFDELYETAASFVRLASLAASTGTHVSFNLDLYDDEGIRQFCTLCYSYEDSYDWAVIPLLYDPALPVGIFRWQRGSEIVSELHVDHALAAFDSQCRSLLAAEQN